MTRKPRIGRWPDGEFYPPGPQRWYLRPQRWYAMFPDTPGAYTPCGSWHEALAAVAEWHASRNAKET